MESLSQNGQVQDWIRSALGNRGIDAEKTLYYCKNLYEYARKTKDEHYSASPPITWGKPITY